jgi:membrane protease YdiL (CAAX protease family)
LLNSNLGAICISALVFGLVHAPGMYLRGAGELDGLGASPSLMTCMSYCLAVQAVPAFFFGIIWTKTKNLWLLMGIHAMMDLLPGFADFVKIWGI